jgi:hypothetical protein
MPMHRSTYLRVSQWTLIAMGIAAFPVLWGSNEGVRTMYNAPLRWIPRDSPTRAGFNRFLAQFESHEMLLVSWPGCTVDDRRLEQVGHALLAVRTKRAASGEPELLNEVLSGYTMLRTLRRQPARLSRAKAIRRMRGVLVGADGQTSCVVVTLTERGALRRRESFTLVLETVQRVTGLQRRDLRVAGPTVDGIATDDESIRSLEHYSIPAILISLVLCAMCLRSIWLTLPILAVGALGQAAMLAIVYSLGITMNAILIVLPPLIFVLTVSAGVHLVNYYYDELRTGTVEGATTRALRKGLVPCTLAAVTTAIGLASLMVSEVQPIRQFGALAAVGVLFTMLLLFLLLPGTMEIRPHAWSTYLAKYCPSTRAGSTALHKFCLSTRCLADKPRHDSPDGTSGSKTQPGIWQITAAITWKYATWITLASFVWLAASGVGLIWLHSSINPVSMLSPTNLAVRDYRWFEQHLGPLVPVEIVIHFDQACTLDPLGRLELVGAAQQKVSQIDILDGALSAASFFPTVPRRGGLRGTARRALLRRSIEANEKQLMEAQYLNVTADGQSWRISARILGLEDFDYGRFLDRLQQAVAPVLAQYKQAGFHGIHATYTGVTSVVYEVEKALLDDLFDSFLTALACVSVIMMLVQRSIRAGLIAMVPNVFPTLILFGTMGWLGQAVDIGTVMTASVALGIAVDGTFHFLQWFRHELALGRPRRKAVAHCFQHCGRALVQTTVICSLGLLVFALSGFMPVRHFAVNMLLLLVAALVGDLIVLPALLMSPLGNAFITRHPGYRSARTSLRCTLS